MEDDTIISFELNQGGNLDIVLRKWNNQTILRAPEIYQKNIEKVRTMAHNVSSTNVLIICQTIFTQHLKQFIVVKGKE